MDLPNIKLFLQDAEKFTSTLPQTGIPSAGARLAVINKDGKAHINIGKRLLDEHEAARRGSAASVKSLKALQDWCVNFKDVVRRINAKHKAKLYNDLSEGG